MPIVTNPEDSQERLITELRELQERESQRNPREFRILSGFVLFFTLCLTLYDIYVYYLDNNLLIAATLAIILVSTVISLVFNIIGSTKTKLVSSISVVILMVFILFLNYLLKANSVTFIIVAYLVLVCSLSMRFGFKGYAISLAISLVYKGFFELFYTASFSIPTLLDFALGFLLIAVAGLIAPVLELLARTRVESLLQQLRIKVIALQNQDLVNSWQEYFTKGNKGSSL